MLVDKATWAEIRRCYEEDGLSFLSLSIRFGPGRSTIQQHYMKEGWVRRPRPPRPEPLPLSIEPDGGTPLPSSPAAAATRARPKRQVTDTPEQRIARLFHLIDIQLDNLEILMTSGDPLSAQDEAHKSRAFTTVVSNLEKVNEAAASLTPAGELANGAERNDVHLKAEKLRRDIAQRLERLNAQWNAQAKPE